MNNSCWLEDEGRRREACNISESGCQHWKRYLENVMKECEDKNEPKKKKKRKMTVGGRNEQIYMQCVCTTSCLREHLGKILSPQLAFIGSCHAVLFPGLVVLTFFPKLSTSAFLQDLPILSGIIGSKSTFFGWPNFLHLCQSEMNWFFRVFLGENVET